MAEIALVVKTFQFGYGHGAHLRMKIRAAFTKITSFIVFGAMFH